VWISTADLVGPKNRGQATIATSPSVARIASARIATIRRDVAGAVGSWRRSTGCEAPAGRRLDGPEASRPAASIFSTKNPKLCSWTLGASRSNVHTASVATPGSTLKNTPDDELVMRYSPRPA